MQSTDGNIFTDNGINIEAVKSLVTSVAKEVEKASINVINKDVIVENERKDFSVQLSKELEQLENIKDDDIIDFSKTDGVNVSMTGKEYKDWLDFIENTYDEELDGKMPTKLEERREFKRKRAIAGKVAKEYIKKVSKAIKDGESIESAKYRVLKELNYDINTPEGEELFNQFTEKLAIRGITEINAIIPNPFVKIDIDWLYLIATDWAILRVSGVKNADVNAPPVTPPESKDNGINLKFSGSTAKRSKAKANKTM